MFILVEGPDGAGKTTLSKNLAEAFGYEYVHFSYPKDEAEAKALFNTYLTFIQTHDNCVVDRMFPSTMVYGAVLRGEPELTDSQHDRLVIELGLKDAVILFCANDTDVLWQRCQERGEEYIMSYYDFEDICIEYFQYMNVLQTILAERKTNVSIHRVELG